MCAARQPKNWDKIVRDFEEEEKKEGNANEKDFFRQLYENSDDDQRRAMVKSMQESCGTKLIMNWGEVKDGKVNPYDSEEDTKKAADRAMEADAKRKGGVTYTKDDLDRLKQQMKSHAGTDSDSEDD